MIALLIASSILALVLFVSLVVLPVAFGTLSKENAGGFARNLFPKYHIILFVASQIAGILAYTPHLKPIAFICGAIFAVHYLWLTPAINKASDQGELESFKKLHIVSVLTHLLAIALYSVALILDFCFF
jgi:Domain of unknown function (DUF4149)